MFQFVLVLSKKYVMHFRLCENKYKITRQYLAWS